MTQKNVLLVVQHLILTSNFTVFCVLFQDVTPVARFFLEVLHGYMIDDNNA
jgi:hypothetical protein